MNELRASFTRPADANAYVSGDLVANDTVAGNVAPMVFNGASQMAIRRARILKTGVGVAGASFRIHLFDNAPTNPGAGDNGVFAPSGVNANYLGSLDVTVDKVFSDGAGGTGGPQNGMDINVMDPSDYQIYGLLEARGAYAPTSGETFTVILELQQHPA